MKHFYASQSPRGFRNEVNVYRFSCKADRDKFVTDHDGDGDTNAAVCGAREITAREARAILGYRGDAVTASYNVMIDGDEADRW